MIKTFLMYQLTATRYLKPDSNQQQFELRTVRYFGYMPAIHPKTSKLTENFRPLFYKSVFSLVQRLYCRKCKGHKGSREGYKNGALLQSGACDAGNRQRSISQYSNMAPKLSG